MLHDIDAAVQTELAHRVRLMGFDRLDAECEPAGDLLVAVAWAINRSTSASLWLMVAADFPTPSRPWPESRR